MYAAVNISKESAASIYRAQNHHLNYHRRENLMQALSVNKPRNLTALFLSVQQTNTPSHICCMKRGQLKTENLEIRESILAAISMMKSICYFLGGTENGLRQLYYRSSQTAARKRP
jgi:hypothetical protein